MLKAITSIATGERGSTAWLSRWRSLLEIRYLASLTSIATYALIVLGGTVRATDSGLACPDWPRCHGQLIPPLDTPVLIEYSHRLAAASVGVLILGMAVTVWLWHRDNRLVLAGATAAILLLIAQVLVGGVTVNMELPDTVVAAHLAIALVLLAVLIVTACGAFWQGRRQVSNGPITNGPISGSLPSSPAFPILAAAAALATFVLIIIGSYVANSGASLVYPDWPLFNGKLVSAGGRLADLHYAHRLMAAVVGVLVLAVVVQALRLRSGQAWRGERPDGRPSGRRPILLAAVSLALVLYVAQVFVGASNIWLELATSVRIAHLALASALWAMLVLAVTWGYLEGRGGTGRKAKG